MEELDLLDWKRRVFELYRQVRHQAMTDPLAAWTLWRAARDELFRTHPQSPIPLKERARFSAIDYFDYDADYRVLGRIERTDAQRFDIPVSDDTTMSFTRFGVASFEVKDVEVQLEAYWLEGYGGGLFLPFRDATSGHETYGAGRYVLDTVKGADLGAEDGALIVDLNFAYNPSCSYDDRWACPLAPPPNHLSIKVRAGEKVLEQP